MPGRKLNREDFIGKTYCNLTIVGFEEDDRYVRCKCKCGNIKVVNFATLKRGHIRSCGCIYNKILNREDFINKKFNNLTIIEFNENGNYAKCKCDCGNTVTFNFLHMKHNKIRNCGCNYNFKSKKEKQMLFNVPKKRSMVGNKLKEKDVIEIWNRYYSKFKKETCRSLAKEFNVSHNAIHLIVNQKIWTNVTNKLIKSDLRK